MSTISNLIFKNEKHYITSKYGSRSVINTSAGATASFHSGTDYGTNSVKLAQYAIEDGTIISCGTASDGAKYVWVKYPRINKKFLHYHLDKISVKNGQNVVRGTLLGYTGKTGKATGIHLHLGVKDLTTGKYEDPEAFSKKYTEPTALLPSRGYFRRGDSSPNIGKIAAFMRKTFPSYTDKNALGNLFGLYLEAAVKEFQRRTGLKADGYIGTKTIDELKKYGFSEK